MWNNISLHSTSTASPRHRQTAGEDHFEVCRPIRRGDSTVAGNGILRGTRLCRLCLRGWNCQREQQSGPKSNESNGYMCRKSWKTYVIIQTLHIRQMNATKKYKSYLQLSQRFDAPFLSGGWIQISPTS